MPVFHLNSCDISLIITIALFHRFRHLVEMSGHDPRYKGEKGLWKEEDLRRAVKNVVVDKMSKKRAARLNNVPRPTLIRHLKKVSQGLGVKKQPGRPTVLSDDQEEELVALLQDMESRLFGLTISDVRRLVFVFCEKNGISNTFNRNDGMAGRNWIKSFFSRHPQLSVRKPEAVSIQRAIGFNRAKVDRFFTELEKVCITESGERIIPFSNIYNVDESGFSCVQKPKRIVATKGKKNVGALTSGEKGRTITVVCCVSATGTYIPPVFIFPRVRMKQSLMDHGPPGSTGTCTKSGWINEEKFEFWFDHFLNCVRPKNAAQPILLVFDGHSSHTRNLNVVLKARENNVMLLCLPSHCTHRLQPLDVAFFKSLNSHYDDECRKWLREHPGHRINEDRIPGLFSIAYGKSATVATAINGFKKTGIAPLDRAVFSDADFHGADATDQPLQEPEPVTLQQPSQPAAVSASIECAETSTTHNDVITDGPDTRTVDVQLSCDSVCANNNISNQLDQPVQVVFQIHAYFFAVS